MARASADVAARTIRQLAQSKWQSSGLSNQCARRLRLKPLSAKQVKGLNAKFHEAGAMLIPYFDLDGKPTRFFRVRYLEKLPGAAGLLEKPQRYDQLPVLQEAYYPPRLEMTWRDVAKDTSIPILITEGELKAACACHNGLPMLALGGVYSFMSGKRAIDLLPSLKEIIWQGRTVYIVYDNDLVNNFDVLRAQHLLAQRLLAEGATIKYVALPPGPEKGVDDYIVKHGVDKFKELMANAAPFLESDALWKLNSEVIYIRKINTVVECETGLLMDPESFKRHLYVDRFFMKQVEKGTGKNRHVSLEETPLAPRWMEWQHKSQLWDLTYSPGEAKIVDGKAWNTWDGWGVKPKRGSVEPWTWLLDFLFANDPKARKYFEQWCAYPIQNPGAKLYTACVIWSRVKRLGKSMLGIALAKIYGLAPMAGEPMHNGPQNAIFVNSRQLKSNFNAWAKDRQLVIGEEITAGEARIDADYLKYIITAPVFTVDTKYKPQVEIPNHTNFLFLSNHPDAIFVEDYDKRYMIHGVRQNTQGPREKYEWCDAWLHNDGPAHLMDYFLRMNLKGFNPREHAPETLSKDEMTMAGKTDTGLWVMRLQEDPTTALKSMGQAIAAGCDLFTPDQLYRAFDPEGRGRGRASVASLGRQLASAGFRQINGGIPVGTATGIHRLYAVRRADRWEQSPRKEIRDHYDSFFGPKSAGGVK